MHSGAGRRIKFNLAKMHGILTIWDNDRKLYNESGLFAQVVQKSNSLNFKP